MISIHGNFKLEITIAEAFSHQKVIVHKIWLESIIFAPSLLMIGSSTTIEICRKDIISTKST